MPTIPSRRPIDRRAFLSLGAAGGAAALLRPTLTAGSSAAGSAPPKVSLAHLPTPLEELPRLTERLGGPRLLIKRDDQTGLATGGNKARKLEYLVADALAAGADTLVTSGSVQSNHCRQTAAAAARCGLRCVLLLRGAEPEGHAEGNLLLDRLLGAELRIGDQSLEEAAEQLRSAGHRPYVIPVGGSNAVGATGYAMAMQELLTQLEDRGEAVDWIVTATGSGGTQGGMAVGARAHGYRGRILGVSVSRDKVSSQARLAELAGATARHLQLDARFSPSDFHVDSDHLGDGYGQMGDRERRAIRLLAETEGILLDPVYTGRAFGGMLDLIARGTLGPDGTVLFWHTGGTPALFVERYAAAL